MKLVEWINKVWGERDPFSPAEALSEYSKGKDELADSNSWRRDALLCCGESLPQCDAKLREEQAKT